VADQWIVTVKPPNGPVVPRKFADKPKALKAYRALLKLAEGTKVKVQIYGP